MKKIILNHWMNIIKNNKNYDNVKLAEIEYGLTAIYLTISKLIVIALLSVLLGIFKEMIIFLLIYNVLRMPSFGIHATKSWICLITSSIIFIGLPIVCINIHLNTLMKVIIGTIGCLLMFKNSPADTKKRPIVNPKRRLTYKLISTLLAIIFVILSITIKNNYISNCLIFGLILQNALISPFTYRIFKQPYNNYKEFLRLNPDFLNKKAC